MNVHLIFSKRIKLLLIPEIVFFLQNLMQYIVVHYHMYVDESSGISSTRIYFYITWILNNPTAKVKLIFVFYAYSFTRMFIE